MTSLWPLPQGRHQDTRVHYYHTIIPCYVQFTPFGQGQCKRPPLFLRSRNREAKESSVVRPGVPDLAFTGTGKSTGAIHSQVSPESLGHPPTSFNDLGASHPSLDLALSHCRLFAFIQHLNFMGLWSQRLQDFWTADGLLSGYTLCFWSPNLF